MAPAPEPFRDLVDESLDEAAFLWTRWERELTSLTRNLDEVWSWTEDRLHGALDGVRAGGSATLTVAGGGLASGDPGRITAATAALASRDDSAAVTGIVDALARAEGTTLDAMIRGLEVAGAAPALRAAATVLADGSPERAGALCRLKAFHRALPGRELVTAMQSGLPGPQVQAAAAALHVPARHAGDWFASASRHDQPLVRPAIIETAISKGIDAAWRETIARVRRMDAEAAPYLKFLALAGRAAEHELVYAALRVPALQVAAIWAVGHLGTVQAVETCLAGMRHETLARACGEAYSWITGTDLERDSLARAETPPEPPAFEDDDLDADLVPPPEALWPLPDADAVRAHWETIRESFGNGVRHVLGRPATPDVLADAVERGPMRRRADLVFELRVKTRGRYDVETRAFTPRQRQMMTAARMTLSS